MNAGLIGWLARAPWAGILGLMLEVSVKAAVVCALAGIAVLLMRRSSAHARGMVWVFTLVVLLALPLAGLVSPLWNVPVIPAVESWFARGVETGALVVPADKALEAPDALGRAARGPAAAMARAGGFIEGWHAWAFLVWVAGVFLSLIWVLVRTALGRRILGRCDAAGPEWDGLLAEASAGLGLRRRVRLFESCEVGAAVTVGAINPAIVVPAGASGWPAERRRYILSHELAHIKRWDGLIEVLVLVARSMYWFNPLVWLAVRSLRIERERDCDDAVLNAGARPSDYAMCLMDIAADLGAARRPAWQLSTVSQGSNLKERIMCILNPKIDRNRGRRRAGIVTCLLMGSIIIPLSISGIRQTVAQDKSDKAKQEEALKRKEAELKAKQAQLEQEQARLEKEAEHSQQKDIMMKMKMAGMSRELKIKMSWEKIASRENSAAAAVHDAIVESGPEAGVKMVKKLKQSGDYVFKESEFNTLGYLFLFQDKVPEARAVFELNVKMYPESWNVYDSLGESYIAAGDYENAKKYYEKSLALNAENENGKKMLAKIEEHERTGAPVIMSE
jgi:beta-lactamase regulating signal transducer with metallopeptidase domain